MTTQREIAADLGLPIHPPKVEIFDLTDRTNTDAKQRVRRVDEYRAEPFGLYMARPMIDHPDLDYLESWLLPGLNLRISDYRGRPGRERNQDFYVDIVRIEPGEHRWRTVDLYLDVAVRQRQDARVLDSDEFVTALRAELLDDETARRAMDTTHRVVDGLARHEYDLPAWLHTLGIELSWRHTG
ncbi:hypothetical protein SAMN04487820_104281 [Actinopolyspora mzabensis]|uniref:DUF402 domain-containing protein n=1 Tax=Actinopolyspora mzabensis TaxID=995066 RepID=A0A1G8Z7B3_ACTMZ|nr:DUF402 domain-containing protein [Actinopolyspora mzabensis]SDK10979.1 hypothetical protein SAMN04487820_104281 [Actinopolyspora mzabensis]